MRRTVLILPGLLSEPDGYSFLRQSLPTLSTLAELGSLSKIAAAPPAETPEAMLLGMSPESVTFRQGPLTISALGHDPPERSTHFHLSLMSFDEGIASLPGVFARPEEVDVLLTAAKRLDTKLLTILKGEEMNHGLVWESVGDMGTTSAAEVDGKQASQYLPEGDGDVALRRLIDDSINLLSSLELNERRIDQGLPAFNLLWPWGHGVRHALPNLALKRGEPAIVESASLRLAGLTRLVGYRHGDRGAFGRGLSTKLRAIAGRALERESTIVFIDVPVELRNRGNAEELDWFVREVDRKLLLPLLDGLSKTPSRISLIAPGPVSPSEHGELRASSVGLALEVDSRRRGANSFPFDERSLEEKAIPAIDLWTAVAAALVN